MLSMNSVNNKNIEHKYLLSICELYELHHDNGYNFVLQLSTSLCEHLRFASCYNLTN